MLWVRKLRLALLNLFDPPSRLERERRKFRILYPNLFYFYAKIAIDELSRIDETKYPNETRAGLIISIFKAQERLSAATNGDVVSINDPFKTVKLYPEIYNFIDCYYQSQSIRFELAGYKKDLSKDDAFEIVLERNIWLFINILFLSTISPDYGAVGRRIWKNLWKGAEFLKDKPCLPKGFE